MKLLIIPCAPLLILASISWGGLVGNVPLPVAAIFHAAGCLVPVLLFLSALMLLHRAARH